MIALNKGSRPRITGWPLAVGAGVLLLLVYWLQNILVGFALAAAVAYVLNPFVERLRRLLGIPRWPVALFFYLCIAACAAGIGWWGEARVTPRVVRFSSDPGQNLHLGIARLLGGERPVILGIPLDAQVLSERISTFARNDINYPRLIQETMMGTVLFFVLLFYFMVPGPAMAGGLLSLAPPEHRPAVMAFAAKANPVLSRYIRGLLLIVVLTTLLTWVGVRLVFHLPYAGLLSVATGVLELLPVVGPTVSAFLLCGVAALHGGSIWTFMVFAVFCFGLRIGIDQFIGPIILGRAVMLSPVAVIFGFLAGWALFGLLGVLLAIPAMALSKIWLEDYYALPIE